MQKDRETTLQQVPRQKESKKKKKSEFTKFWNEAHFQVLTVHSHQQQMVRIVIPPIRVDLIRIWLKLSVNLGEEDDGSDLAKEQKDAVEANHDFWSISGSFIYRGHGVNQENYMCLEKNHFLFQ